MSLPDTRWAWSPLHHYAVSIIFYRVLSFLNDGVRHIQSEKSALRLRYKVSWRPVYPFAVPPVPKLLAAELNLNQLLSKEVSWCYENPINGLLASVNLKLSLMTHAWPDLWSVNLSLVVRDNRTVQKKKDLYVLSSEIVYASTLSISGELIQSSEMHLVTHSNLSIE